MIHQDKEKTLNIYRASAGSGKTHLLTGFYIKLLFVPDLLPNLPPETSSVGMHFSEVLAVTFTNKATAEMKGRIIDELYLLSTKPEKSDYREDLLPHYSKGGQLSDAVAYNHIREKAKRLLIQILNEYSQFNISTIDSFFQKIVRSFARELNIPGNYELELDADRALDAALSAFLDKLDSKAEPELFDWMLRFSKRRIGEGSGWDFRRELSTLAKEVLGSEEYHTHSEAIRRFTSNRKELHQYAKMLDDIVENWKKNITAEAQKGLDLLTKENIQTDLLGWGGSGTTSTFTKLLNEKYEPLGSRFKEVLEKPDKLWKDDNWKKAGKQPDPKLTDKFHTIMTNIADLMSGDSYRNFKTASAIRAHFFELGILANIDKELTEYCNEQNVMLLNSTTEMLSRLIENDDAPFIYEKTGTRIHSYMIDEFQDTSGMQWGNFMPLVSNAVAEGYQNLIVGDVKQSIYRWRGGDWNLLDSEINSFQPRQHYDDSSSLTTNWRSLPTIVNFNNAFFTQLAGQIDGLIGSDRLSRIYGDVQQSLPEMRLGADKPQGHLEIGFLRPTDAEGNVIESPKKEDLVAEARRQLPLAIIRLQEHGYQPGEIAILCRTNEDCRWSAEALLNYKHEHPECPYSLDIISNEALRLSTRPSIQAIIAQMKHLLSPDSPLLRVVAWCGHYEQQGLSTEQALANYFSKPEGDRLFHAELAHRPLYEMTEALIALLPAQVQRADLPFLQTFRDVVLEYASKHSSDLSGFLNWWQEKGYKSAISTPEGQNAITILSVHKSKGLGMPAVVMPFANWDIDISPKASDLIWCEPKEEPFKQDILLPLQLKGDLSDTIFAQDYLEEREKAVIDNVNTAYVAFTRAKEAMILLAPQPDKPKTKKKKKEDETQQPIPDLKEWLAMFCRQQGDGQEGITLGDWQRAPKKEEAGKTDAEKNTDGQPTPEADIMVSNSPHTELPKLSILHDPAKPDVTAKQRGTYIHLALQNIRTVADASQVISQLYLRGDIDPAIITEADMQQTITQLLQVPEVSQWFSPQLRVLNELGMMDQQGNLIRADRVIIDPQGIVTVIDYKTGDNHAGYRNQVLRYMQALRDMGFAHVEGYLLFIKEGRVVKVKESARRTYSDKRS